MTKITAYAAEMLAFSGDGTVEHGWTRVAREESGFSRWHRNYTLVLKDPDDGLFWGLLYSVGATEEQENDYPWMGKSAGEPIELVRLYPHPVTRVEYRTEPAQESA